MEPKPDRPNQRISSDRIPPMNPRDAAALKVRGVTLSEPRPRYGWSPVNWAARQDARAPWLAELMSEWII